jgi:Fic family protein
VNTNGEGKMKTHRWAHIADLPPDWTKYTSTDLASLADIWKEHAERLKDSDAIRQFNTQLSREWAIETGIIENLYTIDRGVTQILIERGIEASLIPFGLSDKPAELIVSIIKDQQDALDGLFDFVAQRRNLSTSYIRELHQAFTRHQDYSEALDSLGRRMSVSLLKGEWKRLPNNPSRQNGTYHEYCPPEHVASEMDALVQLHVHHCEVGVPPEIEAAWLHHRFTQIHPFQDGNGRVARALASLVFVRAGWFPLVVTRDHRDEYIRSLESGDKGELRAIVDLFVRLQRNALIRALSISDAVLRQEEPVHDLISSAADRLKERRMAQERQMTDQAFQLTYELESVTKDRFDKVVSNLNSELEKVDTHYHAISERSNEDNDYWFRRQIIMQAREHKYFADTRTYRSWVRIRIREERQTELVLSFHALGVQFLGVMAVSAFLEHRERDEDGEINVEGPYGLSREPFQFVHREKRDDVIIRFGEWLNEVLIMGLEQWRKQI